MRVLFHQLFQPEPWKLYSNLGVFSLTFTPVDHAFAVLGVFHALSGTERVAARRLLHRHLGTIELLAAGSKELGNVVNGVVFVPGISAAARFGARAGTLPF